MPIRSASRIFWDNNCAAMRAEVDLYHSQGTRGVPLKAPIKVLYAQAATIYRVTGLSTFRSIWEQVSASQFVAHATALTEGPLSLSTVCTLMKITRAVAISLELPGSSYADPKCREWFDAALKVDQDHRAQLDSKKRALAETGDTSDLPRNSRLAVDAKWAPITWENLVDYARATIPGTDEHSYHALFLLGAPVHATDASSIAIVDDASASTDKSENFLYRPNGGSLWVLRLGDHKTASTVGPFELPFDEEGSRHVTMSIREAPRDWWFAVPSDPTKHLSAQAISTMANRYNWCPIHVIRRKHASSVVNHLSPNAAKIIVPFFQNYRMLYEAINASSIPEKAARMNTSIALLLHTYAQETSCDELPFSAVKGLFQGLDQRPASAYHAPPSHEPLFPPPPPLAKRQRAMEDLSFDGE